MRALIGKRIRINGGAQKSGAQGESSKLRRRKQAEWDAIENLVQREAENEAQGDFMRALRPLLRHLGNHARHELQAMEARGKLEPDQIVFADLLDEIVNRAWSLYPNRPRWLEFDLWLTNLADEILAEQAHRNSQ